MRWGELLNGLMAASLSAAVIILAVLPLRTLFRDRTPRWAFCLLWDAALARLLVLTALPSPVSVWRWLPPASPALSSGVSHTVAPKIAAPVTKVVTEGTAAVSDLAAVLPVVDLNRKSVLTAVWLTVGLAQAAWFLWSHLRSRRLYADSLPCGDTFVRDWLAARRLRRNIQVRTSDRIAAPLTYGVARPVVLLPSGMEWTDKAALSCILEHEYQHIRRFDTPRKALLAAALCLHWFNPLVWVLYVLSNRDMELACDEAVTAQGVDRAEYAQTLLSMEEQRGRWGLSGSHFSQNALEERIRCIMQYKKTSIAALVAVVAVMSITVAAFASAAPNSETGPQSRQNVPKANHIQAVENDVMVLSKGGEDDEKQYSVDGGKTWLSEERYHAEYGSWGDDWQVEWWTAEDYAAWLEEEKQALQSIIGERCYTGGEGWFTWDQKRVDETVALYESILEDIKNGALYSKTITDKNGGTIEDVALGSGTMGEAAIFTYDEKDAVVPKEVDEAALLEELKNFGISGKKGNLVTSHGILIRYLVDGVAVGDSGYSIQYVYNNPDGVVDVHTLHSVVRNPDGSYDLMGELTGTVASDDERFDQGLIDSAAASAAGAQTVSADTDGEDVGTLLKKYEPFGLRYEIYDVPGASGSLRMSWNGKPVHSLFDTETGTWYANNMHGTELDDGAVDLETVYRAGQLCGLKESQPPHEVIHGVEIAAASGSGAEGGRSFEEVFARYQPYGLSYSPRESGMGSLTWNGQAVKSFADLNPDGGAFSYEDPYAENGLRVYAEYDAAGDLTGLCAQ